TVSSLQRDGFQKRERYISPTPYVSDPVGAFHSSGTEAFDTQGGQSQQTVRAKLLWLATDANTATVTAGWTQPNQPATASAVIRPVGSGPDAVFGGFYNMCIEGIQFVPTAQLVCGPRGTVGTPLWNANANPATARLIYGPATALTGNLDTTFATGPNFDK